MGRRKKGDKVDGWVNFDKPLEMTSTQAVGKVRRFYNAQKAGHAGTLDPLATGILPIALGEATKTIPYTQDALKTYEFTVTWGEQRSTDDAEGEVIASSDVRPALEDIKAALPAFTGEITQTPPRFSAIKIDGQRAYDLARDGQEFEIKSRTVFVESLTTLCHLDQRGEILDVDNRSDLSTSLEMTSFRMTCGKGTYVRSLARDLALDLGTVGYISALRRTQVGVFDEKSAILLDKLEEMGDKASLEAALLPVETALDDIPAFPIKQNEAANLRNGQVLSLVSRPDFQRLEVIGAKTGSEILVTLDGKPVALTKFESPSLKPFKVFNL